MPDPVVVTVRRSGGVTGISRHWSVDSAMLPAADAAELRRLAGGINDALAAPVTPDAFQYEVEVRGESGPHRSARVDRASAAELLDFVTARDPLQ